MRRKQKASIFILRSFHSVRSEQGGFGGEEGKTVRKERERRRGKSGATSPDQLVMGQSKYQHRKKGIKNMKRGRVRHSEWEEYQMKGA